MYKVLIVDDEPIFRLGLQNSVNWEELGFQVCGMAENGVKALEQIRRCQPHLVFLDIKMPQMDGLEVMRTIKEEHLPVTVVILSCLNEYEYVREAMRLGAIDYLFKPLMEPADICRIAQEAIGYFTTVLQESPNNQDYDFFAGYSITSKTGWENYLSVNQKTVVELIRKGNISAAKESLYNILKQSIACGCRDRQALCRFSMDCLTQGIKQLRTQLLIDHVIASHFEQLSALYDTKTIEDLVLTFEQLLMQLYQGTGYGNTATVSPAIRRIQEYVHQNYNQDISLDFVSQMINMNKTYFCKQFKKETGVSFVSYLTKVRMSHAYELLSEGRYAVYQVAEMTGYRDYYHFCKTYEKWMGISPSETMHTF